MKMKDIRKILGAGLIVFASTSIFACSEIEDGTNDIDSWPNITYTPKLEHPGILHTERCIERMRNVISSQTQPGYGSYQLLEAHPLSQADYAMSGPYEKIARDGEYAWTKVGFENDFSAAYLNALMWALTENKAHAEKALQILVGYAETLKEIPETNDTPLLVGFEGFKIIYATELLKYTYEGVKTEQLAEIDNMLKSKFIPAMENFYNRAPYTNGNWGAAVTRAYLSAAILWDDKEMYQKAVNFYLYANDNGTIGHYIDGETGQIQESGRDQGHCMLGIGAMASICEIAYQQGNDLYEVLNNRLMKGFEYVAKYNLGYNVPFKTWTDVTGKYCNWTEISPKDRGDFAAIFEMVYNHYVTRKQLSMPYTEKVLQEIRPEGYDSAQPGFGTLLFNDKAAN